jgi:hypothetical protein
LIVLSRRAGFTGWPSAAFLLAALVVKDPAPRLAAAVIGLSLTALPFPLGRRSSSLAVVAAIAIAAGDLILTMRQWADNASAISIVGLSDVARTQFQMAFCWLLIPALFLGAIWRPKVGLAIGAVGLALAAINWDQRTPWVRYRMAGRAPLQVTGPVLWGPRASNAWFLLKQPSFLSVHQSSGLLFSRDTSMAWKRRLLSAGAVVPDKEWSPGMPNETCEEALGRLDEAEIGKICEAPEHPVTIIYPSQGEPSQDREFRTPVPERVYCVLNGKFVALANDRFHVHACNER